MSDKRRVFVVPHTHWDREWYLPFQTFRLQLVDLVDDLLELLEGDPSFRHFQMDGQMACVDDYLDVRPERRETIRELTTAGRLTMGPWYTLPDEFLVSGESMIRNLQLGMSTAAEFGGAMEVGYLPDMFGHVAQMPQLFRQFGFDSAVVWRGVPRAVRRSSFWWESPDGSRIRTEYLPVGYGNGAHLPDDGKDLLERIVQFEDDHGDKLIGPVLWMNGTDHLMPSPWLGRTVAEANEISQRYELMVSSLPEYLAASASAVDGAALDTWQGELRSGARANLLMGVTSNRTDIRQLAAQAERGLEQLAEPVAALFDPADRWPASLLDAAWKGVILNEAHDSICACSVDEVCDAVTSRFQESLQITDGLVSRTTARFATSLGTAGHVVVNPSARPRSAVVELDLPGEGPVEGTQLLREKSTTLDFAFSRAEVEQNIRGMLDFTEGVVDVDIDTTDDGGLFVTVHRDRHGGRPLTSAPVVREMATVGDPDPSSDALLRIVRPPARRILAHVADVPGYGWKAGAPGALTTAPVVAAPHRLSNGRMEVEVDPATGTWSANGHTGLGRLVDGGDDGDTYNYNEPDGDRLVDTAEEVRVELAEDGPLRSQLTITTRHRWPERVVDGTRVGTAEVEVTTVLELRADEPFVRVVTMLDNTTRDHRLRAHFPLPHRTDRSRAECAFDVVERGLVAEGGKTELGLSTYPSRRFVQAGGLTIAHEGLPEYQLVDLDDEDEPTSSGELALTLLRCTGMLSQGPMRYRPMPAGPLTPIEGPQMQGPVIVRYAVTTVEVDPYALVEDAFVPLLVEETDGHGERAATGSHLEITGAEVSALRRRGPLLEVRVFNPSDAPTVVEVPGRSGWTVDLRGRPLAPMEHRLRLGPHEIATMHLDEHPAPGSTGA